MTEHDWPALTAAPSAQAEPVASEPLVDLKLIGCVPASMADDPGIKALARMAQSIAIFKDGKNQMAVWDHFAMFEVRDRICELAAPPSAQAQPQPLKRGITGICRRSTCECESNGLGLECVWLGPTDAEMERRTGEPHIDGWPLYSGLPPAQPQEPPRSASLTDEQIDALWRSPMSADWEHREFARAIERAHGISTPEEQR